MSRTAQNTAHFVSTGYAVASPIPVKMGLILGRTAHVAPSQPLLR
jgi:hypothetical protein